MFIWEQMTEKKSQNGCKNSVKCIKIKENKSAFNNKTFIAINS